MIGSFQFRNLDEGGGIRRLAAPRPTFFVGVIPASEARRKSPAFKPIPGKPE